jgi:hypothetical protein
VKSVAKQCGAQTERDGDGFAQRPARHRRKPNHWPVQERARCGRHERGPIGGRWARRHHAGGDAQKSGERERRVAKRGQRLEDHLAQQREGCLTRCAPQDLREQHGLGVLVVEHGARREVLRRLPQVLDQRIPGELTSLKLVDAGAAVAARMREQMLDPNRLAVYRAG